MRDRTRRFTVGFGSGQRHLRILAADEKTKAWADRNFSVIQVALMTLEQQIQTRKLASDRDVVLPDALANVETTGTLVLRFAELMNRGFPDEKIEVTAEVH